MPDGAWLARAPKQLRPTPNTFAEGNPNCLHGDKAQLATPAGLTEFIAHLSVCRGHTEGSPAEGHVLPQLSSCKQQQRQCRS